MPSITKILRVLADVNRLRILLLLKADELSVAELQEILAMGQSTISTHLSQLKQAGLVEDRRTGKSNFYRLKGTGFSPYNIDTETFRPSGPEGNSPHPTPEAENFLHDLLARADTEIPEAAPDKAAMRRVLKKRQDKMRAFFDSVAGRLGKNYVPGKSFRSLAEALLRLLPPLVIADLGAGEGGFALQLAPRAKQVIAVDSSAKMVEVGRELAARHGIANIDYRLGDMEEIPIASASVDLVFFSQSLHHALHPERALHEAARILSPGGRIVVLDLLKHRYEEARDLYADEWLGFTEAELETMLQKAGFFHIEATVVDKESEAPQFQTLLAVGDKPSSPTSALSS